jgi:hypothetical protein
MASFGLCVGGGGGNAFLFGVVFWGGGGLVPRCRVLIGCSVVWLIGRG